jgi:hypothetical protein
LVEGEQSRKCQRIGCDDEIEVAAIPKLNHVFTTYTPTLAATCIATGSETATCDLACGTTDTRDIPIDPNAHNLVAVNAVAANCTTAGNTAGHECTRCTHTTVTPINALGHDLENVSAVAATCLTAGNTAGERCKRAGCDHTTVQPIAALGHDLENVSAVAATCLTAGNTAGERCKRAGCDHTTVQPIAALGHDYETVASVTIPATCDTDGEKSRKCQRTGCDAETDVQIIPQLTGPECETSIRDLDAHTTLEVFPNPVNYELTITNYEWKSGDIVELYDMSGKRVYSHPVPRTSHPATFSIDMSNFQSGNYILRIGNRVAKIVIN